MITQAIKSWFQKMFAWWPWKQSTPLEYQHVPSAVTSGTAQETSFWISKEGTVPQAGATSRRFTLESRTERLMQSLPETSNPPPNAEFDSDVLNAMAKDASTHPTVQHRLEFLRYLVQQGIVNEGFEDK